MVTTTNKKPTKAEIEAENKQLRDRVAELEQQLQTVPEQGDEPDPMAGQLGDMIDEYRERDVECAVMVLPLADPPSHEAQSRRVDFTLSNLEKKAFMRLRSGLRQSHAPLTDDAEPKTVHSNADVVRWLIRQISLTGAMNGQH